jgi:NAD-dependent SIR2 family protein deacetylase
MTPASPHGVSDQIYQAVLDTSARCSGAPLNDWHKVIATLNRMGKLSRFITESADGLSSRLGIPPVDLGTPRSYERNVLLEVCGNINWLRCSMCKWREPLTEYWRGKLAVATSLLPCPACDHSKMLYVHEFFTYLTGVFCSCAYRRRCLRRGIPLVGPSQLLDEYSAKSGRFRHDSSLWAAAVVF